MKAARERLPLTIKERFASSAYIALRGLDVDLVDDVIIVSGQVRSHYLKQIAHTIAQGIAPRAELRFSLAVSDCSQEPMDHCIES